MNSQSTQRRLLVTIVTISLLCIVIALVLYGILDSTGVFESQAGSLGGAAAGFAVILTILIRWYNRLDRRHLNIDALREENRRLHEMAVTAVGYVDEPRFYEARTDGVVEELRKMHRARGLALPVEDALMVLRKLFSRNTFSERIAECTSEDWPARLRAATLARRVLEQYSPFFTEHADPKTVASYESLVGHVARYADRLTALFADPKKAGEACSLALDESTFRKAVPEALPKLRLEATPEGRSAIENADSAAMGVSESWTALAQRPTLQSCEGRDAASKPSGIVVYLSDHPRDEEKSRLVLTAFGAGGFGDQPAGSGPRNVRRLTRLDQLTSEILQRSVGLYLGMTYKETFTFERVTRLQEWVRTGGHLVLSGFELGPRHHGTNLNTLAETFGLRFNTDIVLPREWGKRGKPYGVPVEADVNDDHDPLLKGVGILRLVNACTVGFEPGGRVILGLGDLMVGELLDKHVSYSAQGDLEPAIQEFEARPPAPRTALVAQAPMGLTGKGGVIAVGTWEFGEETGNGSTDTDSIAFLSNIQAWLEKRA